MIQDEPVRPSSDERTKDGSQLAESARSLLAAIVESSNDAIISKTLDGVITSWNAAAERLFGYTADDAVGQPVTLIIPTDRRDEEQGILARLRRGERIEHLETLRIHKSGRLLDISLTISPVRDGQGRIVGASKIARDITEQKRAEQARRESEERFRLLADTAPVLIWMSDAEQEGIYFNKPWLDFTGRPLEQQLGSGWLEALHPEDRQALLEVCLAGFRERRSFTFQFRLRSGSGEYHWMLDTGSPRFTPDGRFVGFIGTCVDVTEQKVAEQTLRESEERFRTLADNIAQFAWMADNSGWLFWYNKRWFEYTGTTLEDMKGWGWQSAHHPEHVERVTEKFKRHIAAGEPWEDTFPLRSRDGSYRWFLSRAVPIRDEHGNVLRWFGTNTDITERMQMEEALKEADRRKDEFLAMLAHELRNPLVPIRSGLDLLSTETAAKGEVVDLMQRQVSHLVRLVDDLLDVSRIMRGKVELRKEPVELSRILHEAVEGVSSTVADQGQQLTVRAPDEPAWLHADPVRLVQVFANLLNNASKYSSSEGRIEISAECRHGEVVVAVRDEGVGIEPELLPKVFELFTQSSRSLGSAQGGLGIGLTLVQDLVQMHGGTVSAESEGSGRGSTFTVRLPLTDEPKSEGTPQPTSIDARRRRILIVDDNKAAAQMLSLLLTKKGHDAVAVHDGPTALAAMEELRPEIVLLDIGLPGMNGYEVGRTIRQRREWDGVLLVALTGYGQERDRRQSKEAGFDEHLVKPPSWDQIEKLLSHSKLAGPVGRD